MDIQEKTTAEIREGSPPAAPQGEGTPSSADTTSKAVEGDHKSHDRSQANIKDKTDKIKTKHLKSKHKNSKKKLQAQESFPEGTDTDSDGTSSNEESRSTDDECDSEPNPKRKRSSKRHAGLQKSTKKTKSRKNLRAGKSRRHATQSDSDTDSDGSSDDDHTDDDDARTDQLELAKELQILQLQQQLQQQTNQAYVYGGNNLPPPPTRNHGLPPPSQARLFDAYNRDQRDLGAFGRGKLRGLDGLIDSTHKLSKKGHKAPKLDFKRVDQVWDSSIHNFKLQDTTEGTVDAQYDDFLFHVRRTFDWEGKYKATVVDIRSKLLRESLEHVMGNIQGISLVEETPKLDPNMLFLYLNDLRAYLKQLKTEHPSGGNRKERKRERKRTESKRQHLKVLVKYINKDYADVKNSLYPMLENGLITFDLLWALWKPNTLAYTTTYGSQDEPRVFKVEVAEKHHSLMKGDFYYIEGKYFEYDGKQFGFGSMAEELSDFRGARKITSLSVYPLKYHKNEAELRKALIGRGKKFAALSGAHYKSHQGLAYYKKKKAVIKVNINGRIMVDPSIHRRINPNYHTSIVRPKDHDVLSDDEDSDDKSVCCASPSDSDADQERENGLEKVRYVTKVFKDEKGKVTIIRVPKLDEDEEDVTRERLDQVHTKDEGTRHDKDASSSGPAEATDRNNKSPPEFTDEDYLIASPVVFGFAFAEKLWLEFTVSGVKEIQWNENAYESLVLEPKTKDIIKALVESHKYHAAESIDDVIQGKGKGLVAVLHGPPGTGKTLTAEGISELLRCPLYMASAGELGTDSRFLESELQKILDICHAWGAILLLDEADVFLEKRNMHDIHRNALVSIFLRQLEYFQGILFLTTNRVETFDEAFQSRIHIALRYDALDHKAKKAIFKIFIERVRILEKINLMPFTEDDFNVLARHDLNGRQIKNTVRTAQALAVNKREPLSLSHIRQVLEVQMSFDRDLKGGTGYQDAMRSYF